MSTRKRKHSISVGSPYPAIDPIEQGFLAVSNTHLLYYEIVGNPRGKPVCFLHGGPGAGLSPFHRQFFDPAIYKVILFEQRGTNRSTPQGCLQDNTTWDLVSDIEKIRNHFNVEKWMVFGGSWGSTLALIYAQTHPERVTALVLRGIWLSTKYEMDWLYQEGASRIYPEYWENFIAPIPEADRGNLLLAYHTILNGTDEAAKLACGRAWAEWETATYRLASDPEEVRVDGEDPYAAVISAIECHYFHHDSWLEEGQIMRDVHKIAHIPCTIVQGRHDTLCPPVTAYRLHKAYPASELRIVIGGHAANEPAICAELVNATDKYRDL